MRIFSSHPDAIPMSVCHNVATVLHACDGDRNSFSTKKWLRKCMESVLTLSPLSHSNPKKKTKCLHARKLPVRSGKRTCASILCNIYWNECRKGWFQWHKGLAELLFSEFWSLVERVDVGRFEFQSNWTNPIQHFDG